VDTHVSDEWVLGMLMQHIRTESIHNHPVKVEAGWVWVEL
jgi:hypothetical protein